jgi:hypothetical protein
MVKITGGNMAEVERGSGGRGGRGSRVEERKSVGRGGKMQAWLERQTARS